jgi:hypothetical protein
MNNAVAEVEAALNTAAKNIANEKAKRRTRKQKLENNLGKLINIKATGKKYRGKKNLNETIKNYRNAIVAEEEKLAAKTKMEAEKASLKAKAAANRAAEKASRSVAKSTVKNAAPKVRIPTREEMKSLTKNELIARFASMVNVVKESKVNNSSVKAAREEAKAILRVAKAEYDACKEVCKARYDVEHSKAKAIVEGAKMA